MCSFSYDKSVGEGVASTGTAYTGSSGSTRRCLRDKRVVRVPFVSERTSTFDSGGNHIVLTGGQRTAQILSRLDKRITNKGDSRHGRGYRNIHRIRTRTVCVSYDNLIVASRHTGEDTCSVCIQSWCCESEDVSVYRLGGSCRNGKVTVSLTIADSVMI